ncbi:MAG: pyridoxal-phosphate dependent enzyme [Myxococcota bacterium]
MSWRIEREHLQAARALPLDPTPLVPATWLGSGVYLKLETRQPTGSFKIRGALVRLSQLTQKERAQGVVAASAGNHGLGLAEAGRRLGVPVTVFVSTSVPEVKRRGMVARGATLKSAPGSYDDIEALAKRHACDTGAPFVSPFDDPWVAAGNGASLAFECKAQLPELEGFIVPVGGGGLLAGMTAALPTCRYVGVESDVSPAMGLSLRRDSALTALAPSGPTVAEGLEGGVSEGTFEAARRAGVELVSVSEDAIGDAMLRARDALGEPVEGSAAVCIAWLAATPQRTGPVVAVVSGANVDSTLLERLVAERSSR